MNEKTGTPETQAEEPAPPVTRTVTVERDVRERVVFHYAVPDVGSDMTGWVNTEMGPHLAKIEQFPDRQFTTQAWEVIDVQPPLPVAAGAKTAARKPAEKEAAPARQK